MDEKFLVNEKYGELEKYKERALEEFDGIRKFEAMMIYLRYNIPYEVVKELLFGDEEIYDKDVREWYPLDEETGDDQKLYESFYQNYINEIDGAVLDNNYSLFFFGANGNGKTFSALHALCQAIYHGLNGYYIGFKQLLNVYNNAFFGGSDDDSNDKKKMKYLKQCDFLVIDELGKESNNSENTLGVLEEVIKKRVSFMNPTIFCSNLKVHKGELKERYGNSVFSAMMRNYRFFYFSPQQDYRELLREEWSL